jgi:hypothetical protein
MKTALLWAAAAAAALATTGCSNRYTILSVPAVSMTTPSLPEGSSVTPAGKVEAQYCQGDDPIVSKDNNVGLIDEAVAKAQQQSGAKYLSDVTIQQDASCVYVDGTAMK